MPELTPPPAPWPWILEAHGNGSTTYVYSDDDESPEKVIEPGRPQFEPVERIRSSTEDDRRVIAYAAPLYHAAARLARARTLVEQTAAWEEVVRVVGEVEGSAHEISAR